MCYFTGVDYLLYSKNDNRQVFNRLNEEMTKLGFSPKEKEEKPEERYISAFYAKDEAMLEYHYKNGYNTDLNGEGCFLLYSGIEKLEKPLIVADTLDVKNDFAQYAWFPGTYFYFSLTLPGDIEDNGFSKRIFDILIKLLEE